MRGTPDHRLSDTTLIQVVDDQMVLVNLASGLYYSLDEIGTRIVQLLQDGNSLKNAAQVIAAEYDAPWQRIESDIEDLVRELVSSGLVTQQPDTGGAPE